eukprot:CAMPEP_0202357146 /NCGR_PEP_ID=MMETSP1126-20121109/11291_1 /ASSEMBLY_ACC=CAM_ASM_000457 /TAXON_ID=3047 /ORGANISM="Dunaliella tertiolecta, Strain CCMP1320" /LENGTH=110 /DNA_ID=CAMNT_0048949971 /DNA_START=617 /DNA_END=946 /DNA_ORIENTATION=-
MPCVRKRDGGAQDALAGIDSNDNLVHVLIHAHDVVLGELVHGKHVGQQLQAVHWPVVAGIQGIKLMIVEHPCQFTTQLVLVPQVHHGGLGQRNEPPAGDFLAGLAFGRVW